MLVSFQSVSVYDFKSLFFYTFIKVVKDSKINQKSRAFTKDFSTTNANSSELVMHIILAERGLGGQPNVFCNMVNKVNLK